MELALFRFYVQFLFEHPSVTHPVVPQHFSGNKVKILRGAPIVHREDLKKCPGLLNCLNKFFKQQISLETFVPFGQLQGNFSVVFYHAKGKLTLLLPQLVQGIESAEPSG